MVLVLEVLEALGQTSAVVLEVLEALGRTESLVLEVLVLEALGQTSAVVLEVLEAGQTSPLVLEVRNAAEQLVVTGAGVSWVHPSLLPWSLASCWGPGCHR